MANRTEPPRYAQHGKRWTIFDEIIAVKMVLIGARIDSIALKLRRRESAVCLHLDKMGTRLGAARPDVIKFLKSVPNGVYDYHFVHSFQGTYRKY